MRILVKSAKVVDQSSPHHNQTVDLLVEDGTIRTIGSAGKLQEKADKTIERKNLHVSPGWFDMRVNFREPGFEYKEDLVSGSRAALRGGFTGVMLMPATQPPIHSKSEVEFVKTKTAANLVNVIPAGTLSHHLEGKDLSEMYDMWQAGARAFTDDKKSVQDSGLMLRALLYSKNFGGLIMSFPEDRNLSANGQMNESASNVSLGMKGIPTLAEEVIVNRDLFLAEYADARIHISTVSSAKSVDIIRQAKKKGVKVTADAAVHHLVLDDSMLSGFDTNYKVKPPLRTREDIMALIEGLKDGTIDCICTDHSPEDVENKKKEFHLANDGIIGLESAFGLLNKTLTGIPLEKIVALLASNPRKILGLEVPSVKEGTAADLTFFDPGMEWTFSESDIASKSRNTPFIGTQLKGRAIAVMNRGQFSECN